MAYDEDLADRIRTLIPDPDGVTERKMFGGHAFLLHGNMAVAASGQDGLMVRVDPDETDSLVTEDGVARFEMRGRSLNGWLLVDPSASAPRAAPSLGQCRPDVRRLAAAEVASRCSIVAMTGRGHARPPRTSYR